MKRILILVHREELAHQAVEHARNAGLKVGVEMGDIRSRREEAVVSTVQTLNSVRKCRDCNGEGCQICDGHGKLLRMRKFNPHEFGLIITDEGHHGTAKSYRKVYKYFEQNPECKFLFVTATPERADGKGLHNVCDSVAYRMDLRTAIEDGWLCPIRQRFITVDSLDLSAVKTKAGGDLADGDLERAFLDGTDEDAERRLHAVMKPTIDEARGKPFIVFASGCEHAERLTAAGNAYPGVTCELILGTTDREERRKIVQRFKNGETQGLINVGVATEGFDCPAAAVVAVSRPTSSTSLYLQMIGRGTRPLPGVVDGLDTADERLASIESSAKPVCIVLDFVGNSGRHKLVSVADVLAGDNVDPVDIDEAVRDAKLRDAAVDIEELIEKAKKAREEREAREEEERVRRSTRHYSHQAKYSADDVSLFDGGNGFDAFRDYIPKPEGATQKQVNLLVALGVSPERATKCSKRQAGAMISDIKSRQIGGEYRMPFGKFKGKPLNKVPESYISWAKQNIDRPSFLAELDHHLSIMRQPAEAAF